MRTRYEVEIFAVLAVMLSGCGDKRTEPLAAEIPVMQQGEDASAKQDASTSRSGPDSSQSTAWADIVISIFGLSEDMRDRVVHFPKENLQADGSPHTIQLILSAIRPDRPVRMTEIAKQYGKPDRVERFDDWEQHYYGPLVFGMKPPDTDTVVNLMLPVDLFMTISAKPKSEPKQ